MISIRCTALVLETLAAEGPGDNRQTLEKKIRIYSRTTIGDALAHLLAAGKIRSSGPMRWRRYWRIPECCDS